MKACLEIPHLFAKDALRRRRIKSDPKAEEAAWFEDYIEQAFVPDGGHMETLEVEFKELTRIWEFAYAPIRNKVIAHRDKLSKESLDEMFGKTRVAEITELLERLFTVEEAIWELSTNAKPLDFSRKVNPRLREIEDATQGVLDSVPRPKINPELRKALLARDDK